MPFCSICHLPLPVKSSHGKALTQVWWKKLDLNWIKAFWMFWVLLERCYSCLYSRTYTFNSSCAFVSRPVIPFIYSNGPDTVFQVACYLTWENIKYFSEMAFSFYSCLTSRAWPQCVLGKGARNTPQLNYGFASPGGAWIRGWRLKKLILLKQETTGH